MPRFARIPVSTSFVALFLAAATAAATPRAPGDQEPRPEGRAPADHDHAADTGAGEPRASEGGIRVVQQLILDLPGLDMTTLTPRQRERFLLRVNREFCTCGRENCVRDPVANCFLNDPGCRTVRDHARRILNEAKAGK
ncbi:MAG: hypothetical protein HY509_04545 [Acidobacteria bacterium]|nr:hypothetical protein [Acidobacteriota bacterium]